MYCWKKKKTLPELFFTLKVTFNDVGGWCLREEGGGEEGRWTLKEKKHEVTAIPWFLGQWDWNGLLLPSMCIVMVSICPLCVSSPPFFLSAAKATETGSETFCSLFFFPILSPMTLYTLRPPMPCFPYFGMSMCYLLTLCMNDNMSVYSYRELYPIPLVLTK